jgi:DNA-binding MarR family transcriptional regulator
MHNLLFGMKRLHLTAQQRMIIALRSHGLTPARFDVLHLVRRAGNWVAQSELAKQLGISRSTISRMLIGLERRGFIHRESRAPQRSRKWVSLTLRTTEMWCELATLAAAAVTGALRYAFDVGPYGYMRFRTIVWVTNDHLHALRDRCADRATVREPYFDYHPDG